jgi:hypothetical protein
MSWEVDFYTAAMGDSTFLAGINSLALEYKPDATAPYAVYRCISELGTNDLAGVSDEGETVVQLTVWAADPVTAETLAKNAATGVATLTLMNEFKRSLGRDPDEELFGYAIDFSIWFDSP